MVSIFVRNLFLKYVGCLLLILLFSTQVFAKSETTFYHYDLLGSPIATTDQTGKVLWREEYSPWGEKQLKQDASHDNVRGYTGHVNDKETGLTYMQARYYDPQIGRFMGVDPVGFKPDNPISLNRYNYANGNPYKFVDPNGGTAKKIVDIFAKISAKYDNLQCDSCASEMIDAAEKNNITGKLVAVKGKKELNRAGIWSDKQNRRISNNKNHYGVEVDGKVYDNHTPLGVPRKDFEKDLHHPSGLNFKDIAFNAKVGFQKAKDSILSVGTSIGMLGTAIGSALSEEAEAAVNDPIGTAYDWSPMSDFFGEPLE